MARQIGLVSADLRPNVFIAEPNGRMVLALSGTGNPRSMASGVSKATIPTMAGMVAALSGVAMATYLQRKASRERELLADNLFIGNK